MDKRCKRAFERGNGVEGRPMREDGGKMGRREGQWGRRKGNGKGGKGKLGERGERRGLG